MLNLLWCKNFFKSINMCFLKVYEKICIMRKLCMKFNFFLPKQTYLLIFLFYELFKVTSHYRRWLWIPLQLQVFKRTNQNYSHKPAFASSILQNTQFPSQNLVLYLKQVLVGKGKTKQKQTNKKKNTQISGCYFFFFSLIQTVMLRNFFTSNQ